MCSCGNDECQSIGKHPRISKGCKGATTDAAIIEQWWKTWPDANIGIATGTASGLVVLDVDPDREGDKSLAELENLNGRLPNTLESKTGSGGWHCFFECTDGMLKNSAGKVGDGLDVRGEGGYVVAPPSLHRSGDRYEWKNNNRLQGMPTWLVNSASSEKKSESGEHSLTELWLTDQSAILEGERNDKLFKIGSAMRGDGLSETEILTELRQANQDRCQPPLPDSELQTIAQSACRYEPDEPLGTEKLIRSWGDFATSEFSEGEKILRELERGEVGLLAAATNIGKTTLSLNLALQLSAGGRLMPIASGRPEGLKVLYIDGETREARLQRDIGVMQRYFNRYEKERASKNLHIICDAQLGGISLNLSNYKHMQIVKREACKFEPDLIIVDTLSALFELKNENDNAEVSSRVMKPLACLAKETNAAILLLHHIGKQSEDAQAGIKAYRGRGASALGAAARYVLVLTQHPNSPNRVVLTCAKSKGISFPDTVMKLDSNGRWFTTTDEDAPKVPSSYERVVETVKGFNREVSRADIEEALKSLSASTIGKRLKSAVEIGDLRSPKYGFYCSSEVAHLPVTVDDDQVSKLKEDA
jgi:hypothetical protein